MKRKKADTVSDVDRIAGLRGRFLGFMNSTLKTQDSRSDANLIPVRIFDKLVAENRVHMRWTNPETVFNDQPLSRVRMNTDAMQTWLDGVTGNFEPMPGAPSDSPVIPVRRIYKEIFVDRVQFVPWTQFLAQFRKVVTRVAAAIAAARAADPHRIVFLVLGAHATEKSNAWLTGYAWDLLRSLVDYVLTSNSGLVHFFATANDVGELAPELAPIVAGLKADFIYVDDMVYSGEQAENTLFKQTPPMYSAYMHRTTIHMAVAYVTQQAIERLDVARGGATLVYDDSIIRVRPYHERVGNLLDRLLAEYIISWDQHTIVYRMAHEWRPAIVFEHKLADGASLPAFLLGRDGRELGMPPPVLATYAPFYKNMSFRWTNKKSDFQHVTNFTDIKSLFAALHSHWIAEVHPDD